MSDYGFVLSLRIPLSHTATEEKKAARKQLLEQVAQRRKQNYIRWQNKMRLKTKSELDMIV